MKKQVFFILALLLPLFAVAQSTAKVDKIIPQLQYDADFMTFVKYDMLDGFVPVKGIVTKMKFLNGQKVYAISEITYAADGKSIDTRDTYFYLKDQLIAYSTEDKTEVQLYYVNGENVYASRTITKRLYKPYGGSRTLNIAVIKLNSNFNADKAKIERGQKLLQILKDTSKEMFGSAF